jgi:tRNA(fMet)-specific endonuclease VapC
VHLLDSNIVSAAMAADEAVMSQLQRLAPGRVAISSVTLAEVLYGLGKLSARTGGHNAVVQRKEQLLGRLMEHLDVLPWDSQAAAAYAQERVACESDGQVLDHAGLMILAHAGSTGRTLVTRDAALQRRDRKGPHKTRIVGW